MIDNEVAEIKIKRSLKVFMDASIGHIVNNFEEDLRRVIDIYGSRLHKINSSEINQSMEINLKQLLFKYEISTTRYSDNIIIYNNALYELIYLPRFPLTDNTILSKFSQIYIINFELRKTIEINPKIKLIENLKKNKLITGNIDCEAVARN